MPTPRKKRNPIWNLSPAEFETIVKNSTRLKEVYDSIGVKATPSNFKIIKDRIKDLQINAQHFLSGGASSRISREMSVERLKKEWLISDSTASRNHMKAYILKFQLIEYVCRTCGNTGSWNERPLSLQIEHMNGICNDNRLENLCFLCPNCHSQTDTFAGKNARKKADTLPIG